MNRSKAIRRNAAFWLTLITSVGLFVGGFFVPPMGVIDGSILQAAGILLGFGTIGMLPEIITAGKSTRVTTASGTTIEVNNEKVETTL